MYIDPNAESVEARDLKTGDIILIKGHAPRTVNFVEPISQSVSVKIHFSDEFVHITPGTCKYRVVGRDDSYAELQGRLNAISTGWEGVVGVDPASLEGDEVVYAVISLQEQFKLLCDDIHVAQIGYPLASAQIALAQWVYANRTKVRFE